METGMRSMSVKIKLSERDIEFEKILKAIRKGRIKGVVTVTFSMGNKSELFYEIEGQLTSFGALPREKIIDMILGKV